MSFEDMVIHGLIEEKTFVEVLIPEEDIQHWGVLGMKWGVRKDRRAGVKKRKKSEVSDTDLEKTTNTNPKSNTTSVRPKVNKDVVIEGLTDNNDQPLTDEQRGLAAIALAQKNGLDVVGIKEITPDGVTLNIIAPMTDDELRAEINRIRLDKEYAQVIAPQPSGADPQLKATIEQLKMERELAALTAKKKSAASKIVKEIVTKSVLAAGTTLAQKVLTKAGNSLIKKLTDQKTLKIADAAAEAGEKVKETTETISKAVENAKQVQETIETAVSTVDRGRDIQRVIDTLDAAPITRPMPELTSFRGQQINEIIKSLS